MTIGILAIQGDYEAHAKMLDRIGVAHRYVRTSDDLNSLDGIILPGGESTTHLKVMTEEGLFEPLRKFGAAGGPVYGTCAGAILLAPRLDGGPPRAAGVRHLCRRDFAGSRSARAAASVVGTAGRVGAAERLRTTARERRACGANQAA